MTAMVPGNSKTLLNESMLPDRGLPPHFAASDINMMSIMAGRVQTEGQWRELLPSIDLQIIRIWPSTDSGNQEAVIEAMLKS